MKIDGFHHQSVFIQQKHGRIAAMMFMLVSCHLMLYILTLINATNYLKDKF